MSKMVSLYEGSQNTRLEGYILSNGEIHYSWIRNNRNTGTVEPTMVKELINRFDMVCKFNEEQQAKEEFELLGFVL